ncbi:MAG: AAA family ATPase [Polyangiaceae bacterium]|nr:AAA family ATPase [Polyangiaceae bacterium]
MAAHPCILAFAVAHHRPIRQRAELSFVATSHKEEPAFTLTSQHAPHGTFPVLGIWGANASGESSLLSALLFLRTVVQQSHARWAPTDLVPWWPWRLCRDSSLASEYELDFELDGVRYAFGFAVRSGTFEREWLCRWEGTRRQVLYFRSDEGSAPWYFGPSLKGQRTKLAEKVRKNNSLFLSVAAQENPSGPSAAGRTRPLGRAPRGREPRDTDPARPSC